MVKIECYCLFDIAATGVTGNLKNVTLPFTTKTGLVIQDEMEMSRARNRQRNFDTLLQLIGLRTQIFNVAHPEMVPAQPMFPDPHTACRRFSFEIEPQSQWLVDGDEFWILKQDSDGTPMITGLEESPNISAVIRTIGPNPNIIFQHVQDK